MSKTARHLLFHGMLLFLLGLLGGAIVQLLYNPRMGLSAHLAGVQNGLTLMVFGLIWAYADPPLPRITYWTSLFGLYGIWLALLLAALWGTSRSTPLAGAGFAGTPSQELIVTTLLTSASGAIIVATGLMLFGLFTKLNSR